MDKREAIRSKIQKLLAKAESTTYGPEQEALLAKVNELMTEFAIAEWEIRKEGGEKVEPVLETFQTSEANNVIWYELASLAMHVGKFFDCETIFTGLHGKGKWAVTCKIVGFPENVRNAEWLFQSLHLQMMQTLAPRWDLSRELEDNVRIAKEAGMKWVDIWAMAYAAGEPTCKDREECHRPTVIAWQRRYKIWAEERDIKPVMSNPTNYKVNFSSAFVRAVWGRMDDIKAAAKRREKEAASSTISDSTALVLASRQEEVTEAFFKFVGKPGKGVGRNTGKFNSGAVSAGHRAGNSADLGGSGSRVHSSTRGELS